MKTLLTFLLLFCSNAADLFERRAITPSADPSFFVGFFWTISKDKAKNQLDSL
ncbi:hypothetical protein HC174_08350 [Salinimicrobium sp. CDJ15-81-2]|nr:hypothetical protein [Salinimicrobium nanhaiense]